MLRGCMTYRGPNWMSAVEPEIELGIAQEHSFVWRLITVCVWYHCILKTHNSKHPCPRSMMPQLCFFSVALGGVLSSATYGDIP